MKIEMIGSGNMTSNENSACYLVNNKILVDVPNGIEKAIIRGNYDIGNLDCILITHFHADHYFDLPFVLLNLLNSKKRDKYKKLYIFCFENMKNNIEQLISLSNFKTFEKFKEDLNLEIIGISGESFINNNIGEFVIEAFKVSHLAGAYGYVITDKKTNKKVGFTGDSKICLNVCNIVKRSDISFCDTSLLVGNDAHMGINDIEKLLLENNDRKIVATHMRKSTREEIRNLNNDNLLIGEDGLKVNI